jgi:hypothetical protein
MFKTLTYAAFVFALGASSALAAPSFSGTWSVDLRSAKEKKKHVECGEATFELVQSGNEIAGDHIFSTPGCGRLNEGGAGSVKGSVKGNVAALTVISGRNGAVFLGTATLRGNEITWVTTKQISTGDPVNDSPLVLEKGVLHRAIK